MELLTSGNIEHDKKLILHPRRFNNLNRIAFRLKHGITNNNTPTYNLNLTSSAQMRVHTIE